MNAQTFSSWILKPSEKDLTAYDYIVFADVVDVNGQPSATGKDIRLTIDQFTRNGKDLIKLDAVGLAKATGKPVHLFSDLSLRNEHLIGLPASVFVEIQLVTNKFEQNIEQTPIKGCGDKCCMNTYWVAQCNLKALLKVTDLATQKVVIEETIGSNEEIRSANGYCKEPTKVDLDEEKAKKIRSLASAVVGALFEHSTFFEATFRNDFWNKAFDLETGVGMLNMGQWDQAQEYFLKYTEEGKYKDKNRARAYFNLGLVQVLMGNNYGAEQSFRKALQLFDNKDDKTTNMLNLVFEKAQTDVILLKRRSIYQNRQRADLKRSDPPPQLVVNREVPKPAPRNTQRDMDIPKIWSVIVTVADYTDPNIPDLKFTTKDGQLMYNFLRSPNGGLTESRQIKHLSGKEATRANIIKALNETSRQAFDSDFILFFIACHGQPDGEGKEVYFLPVDSEADNLEETAISESEVMKIFNRSKAQKKILIADACHSGSLGNIAGTRASAEDLAITNRLLRQIASLDESAAVFAASSANEKSQETPLLGGGHGVFTHFLVEGLKGAADKDGNGLVTLRESYEYTYRKVSNFTSGKQHPELKGKFVDYLPLGVVKK